MLTCRTSRRRSTACRPPTPCLTTRASASHQNGRSSGETDPALTDEQQARLKEKSDAVLATGREDAAKPLGENRIYADVPHEILKAKMPAVRRPARRALWDPPGQVARRRVAHRRQVARPTRPPAARALSVTRPFPRSHSRSVERRSRPPSARASHKWPPAEQDKQQQEQIAQQEHEEKVATAIKEHTDQQAVERAKAKARSVSSGRNRQAGQDAAVTAQTTMPAPATTAYVATSRGRRPNKTEEIHKRQKEDNESIAAKRREAEEQARKERDKKKEPSGWLSRIGSAIADAFDALVSFVKGVFDRRARKFVQDVINKFTSFVTGLIDAARKAIVGLIKDFADALIAIGDKLLAAFPELRDKFRKGIEKLRDAAIHAVNKIANALKTAVTKLLDALAKALTSLLDGLEKGLLAAVQFVKSAVVGAINFVKNAIALLGDRVLDEVDGPHDGALDELHRREQALFQPIEERRQRLGKRVEQFRDRCLEGVRDLVDGVDRGVPELLDALAELVAQFGERREKLVTDRDQCVREIFDQSDDCLARGVDQPGDEARELVDDVLDELACGVEDPLDKADQGIERVRDRRADLAQPAARLLFLVPLLARLFLRLAALGRDGLVILLLTFVDLFVLFGLRPRDVVTYAVVAGAGVVVCAGDGRVLTRLPFRPLAHRPRLWPWPVPRPAGRCVP